MLILEKILCAIRFPVFSRVDHKNLNDANSVTYFEQFSNGRAQTSERTEILFSRRCELHSSVCRDSLSSSYLPCTCHRLVRRTVLGTRENTFPRSAIVSLDMSNAI